MALNRQDSEQNMCHRVRVSVPGKVNVALHVGSILQNGYHELDTVFEAVSIRDDLEVTRASASDAITLTVRSGVPGIGVPADVPTDSRNLAVRAARAIQTRYGVVDGAHMVLTKRIPSTAGMAGGSADAAAALLAVSHVWGTGAQLHDLLPIAARLGADVPFALIGMVARGRGRGDLVEPVQTQLRHEWVFVASSVGLPTPDVFRQFDRLHSRTRNGGQPAASSGAGTEPAVSGNDMAGSPTSSSTPPISGAYLPTVSLTNSPVDELVRALSEGNDDVVRQQMVNDLQDPALHLRPELAQIVEAGNLAGGTALLSGSGPTVAVLARGREHADSLAVRLREAFHAARILRASGPEPGASIVNDTCDNPVNFDTPVSPGK
ncbi:MAG: 4-(cytidine 5'-diphospho)-2-C-methyl-D-erythritol kinase [Actinomycetaceae bacterium]|nr:4-(cytidine 5'-diphospho)-2-C-methyl-D-erythritol kinase [Actinomycetaceae bacterium]MDY6083540.1 4-(cytidine 5'-diphospho)-2-C-methyl-D-erythritol kinase [Actinomycetaceae bacterium]